VKARAKVFISCGQRGGPERETAEKIANVLRDKGFEPYVAIAEQTLKGLRENIFWNLETSEYFLFVDFRREQFANQLDSRGSLFSHQELALASYLDIDVIVFQQEGVRKEDGLMRFLQANALPFKEPGDLPALVAQRVDDAGWNPGWKNSLHLEMCDPPFTDAKAQDATFNRFFHLRVRNLHQRKTALNSCAFVESISRTGDAIPFRMVELRWAGSSEQFVLVPPGLPREVDLGFVPHSEPRLFAFNSFTTSTQYMAPLIGPGQFDLTYVVASTNFPLARFKARITVGSALDEAVVEGV